MDDLFKLRARLTDSEHKPLAGLIVAVVDVDELDDDDLIGIGKTSADGFVHLSFLGSEFRQDLLEIEETPDILLVVSTSIDDVPKAIFQRRFPEIVWDSRDVDLGDVVLEGVDLARPVALQDVKSAPGIDKRTAHLELNDELVRACMTEVAPIVERLTGWSGLLDDLKLEIADSLAPFMLRESLIGAGQDPNGLGAKVSAIISDVVSGPGAGCALYDAHTHTVIFNSSILKFTSLDGLKVMCGHELVHVGQFKNTPGLRAYNLAHLRGMMASADGDPEIARKRMAYMFELEGYAKYIESDFLQARFFPMALLVYNPSLAERLFQAVIASSANDLAKGQETKTAQYVEGRELYRKRQSGEEPARFSLDVASLYGGAEFVPAAS